MFRRYLHRYFGIVLVFVAVSTAAYVAGGWWVSRTYGVGLVSALDSDGRTPLHDAAAEDHSEAVSTLLAAGADPKARDSNGRTAADYSGFPVGEVICE